MAISLQSSKNIESTFKIEEHHPVLYDLLGLPKLGEGQSGKVDDIEYVVSKGILRQVLDADGPQAQTRDAFAFQWSQQDLVLEKASEDFFRENLSVCFPNYADILKQHLRPGSLILDAGCGSGAQSRLLFEEWTGKVSYIGVDISESVDIAKDNFLGWGESAEFLQADLHRLPFKGKIFDFIMSCGVLHHTPSVERGIERLSPLLAEGGALLIAVYRKPPPVREFSDAFVRSAIGSYSDEEAFDALMPLTRLGIALGELGVEVEVPEDIPFLEIPKGRVNVQRLFHYYFIKMFFRRGMSAERVNLHNFDWYRPSYNATHTEADVRAFCEKAGLQVRWVRETSPGNISAYCTNNS